jgi:hypothetical protein
MWHIHHGHPRAASTPTRGTCMLHRHFVHDISQHTTHVLVCHIGLARSHIHPLLLSLQLSLQTICSTGGSCESLSKPSLFTLSLAPCTNARSKARTHTHARTYACMHARMYARACAHTPAHTCVRSLVFLTSFPRSIAALLLVLRTACTMHSDMVGWLRRRSSLSIAVSCSALNISSPSFFLKTSC